MPAAWPQIKEEQSRKPPETHTVRFNRIIAWSYARMIRFLSLFLFQSLFKRVNIAVPPHSLIRTRCRFLCEFSRRRAVLLWTRACKYLRRPSLFPPRTSHPSIFFHAARGNITVHCWNVPCRINSRFHMTSLPRCVPSEGWVCSEENDCTVSHHSDGAERRWVSTQAVWEGWSGLQHPSLVFQSMVENAPLSWYS